MSYVLFKKQKREGKKKKPKKVASFQSWKCILYQPSGQADANGLRGVCKCAETPPKKDIAMSVANNNEWDWTLSLAISAFVLASMAVGVGGHNDFILTLSLLSEQHIANTPISHVSLNVANIDNFDTSWLFMPLCFYEWLSIGLLNYLQSFDII